MKGFIQLLIDIHQKLTIVAEFDHEFVDLKTIRCQLAFQVRDQPLFFFELSAGMEDLLLQ